MEKKWEILGEPGDKPVCASSAGPTARCEIATEDEGTLDYGGRARLALGTVLVHEIWGRPSEGVDEGGEGEGVGGEGVCHDGDGMRSRSGTVRYSAGDGERERESWSGAHGTDRVARDRESPLDDQGTGGVFDQPSLSMAR